MIKDLTIKSMLPTYKTLHNICNRMMDDKALLLF